MMKRNPSNPLSVAAVILSGAILCAGLMDAPRGAAQNSQPQSAQGQSSPEQSAAGQSNPPGNSSMPGMSGDDMQQDTAKNPAAAQQANRAMSDDMSGDMDMNPHMHMTDLRAESPADDRRAAEIVAALRPAIEKYEDYRMALADGFQIFFPNVPQKIYHFTSRANAIKAQFTFDPTRPTSLLYKKTASGYTLAGAMYTAPRWYSEAQLNARVPLSVARWHQHVNFCLPPRGTALRDVNWKEFGLQGSIATEQACNDVNGRWIPIVFGWMVHVYPFQTDPSKVWAH